MPDLCSYHEVETREQWELLDVDKDGTIKTTSVDAAATSSRPQWPQRILADNQGAIKLASNPQFHDRTKHIDIRYHFVREAIDNGLVTIDYIPTADMRADIMTKALLREWHWEHVLGMGLQAWSDVTGS